MQRVSIDIRINSDRFFAKFLARSNDADGDFTTVGDEDFFKHGRDEERRAVGGES